MATLAARQHNVVARIQLLAAGVTTREIERRIASGHLHLNFRGVYAVGTPNVSQEGRWMAATLAVGGLRGLSHRSAAALWGLASIPRPDRDSRGRRLADPPARPHHPPLHLPNAAGAHQASRYPGHDGRTHPRRPGDESQRARAQRGLLPSRSPSPTPKAHPLSLPNASESPPRLGRPPQAPRRPPAPPRRRKSRPQAEPPSLLPDPRRAHPGGGRPVRRLHSRLPYGYRSVG